MDEVAAPGRALHLLAITCDILSRPVYHFASTSPHVVNVAHLSASLHAEPLTLRERIQEQIDAAGPGLDAVVLAYGLCGGATAGMIASIGSPLRMTKRESAGRSSWKVRSPAKSATCAARSLLLFCSGVAESITSGARAARPASAA